MAIALIALKPTRLFGRLQRTLDATGTRPGAAEVNLVRRWVMIEAHLLLLLPLAAMFVARGLGAG